MRSFTISTTEGEIEVDGTHWAWSEDTFFVYDGDDPTAEIDGETFNYIIEQ